MMSIYTVKLYKLNGVQWVFDDPAKQIYREAFVGGADELIDSCFKMNGWKYNNQMNYTLQFSTKDFPGSTHLEFYPLRGVKEEMEKDNPYNLTELMDTGTYWMCYDIDNQDKIIWLCDTLDEYRNYDDTILYFNIKASKRDLTIEEEVENNLRKLI